MMPTRKTQESEQARCLASLRRAMLALGIDQPPTADEYRRECQEDPSYVRIGRIIAEFRRWRLATHRLRAPTRRVLSDSVRAHLSVVVTQSNTVEDYLGDVCGWLATDPRDLTAKAYDAWAVEANRHARPGERRAVSARTMRVTFKLNFAAIIALAQGRSVEEEQLLAKPVAVASPSLPDGVRFVCLREAAVILGKTWAATQAAATTRRFPPPAATFPGGRLWVESEVIAYARGGVPPRVHPNRYQAALMDARQVSTRLNLKTNQFGCLVSFERWGRVPPPYQTVGRMRVWRRDDVERWIQAHALPPTDDASQPWNEGGAE